MLRRRRRRGGGGGFFGRKKSKSKEMIYEAPADGTRMKEGGEGAVERSELGGAEMFEAPENGRRSPEVEMFVEPPAAAELVGERNSIQE